MASTYKSIFKRWNGTDWDTYYFATRADQVAEITTGGDSVERRFVNGTQKTAIDTYLVTFNAANKLLKLDTNGLIPSANLPFSISDYLTKANPTYSGTMTATNGGSNAFNIQDNKILFGYGTPSGSLAKWDVSASGVNLNFRHDVGSGFVTSFVMTPSMLDVNNKLITKVATPQIGTDAANKEYVDNLIAVGLEWKAPVKAASIGNVTLGVALNTLDGVTLAAGDRVLLKNQTTTTQRGVYTLDASKIPQRTIDDSAATDLGHTVFVEGGTTNNDTVYHCNAANTWVLVSKTDTYDVITNGGLEKSGTNFGIKAGSVTNAMIAENTINVGTKLSAFAGSDTIATWNDPAMTAASTVDQLTAKLSKLYSSIKLLRGTANYNTNNSQTIAGAYTTAEAKNRTYRGDGAPGTTGFVTGDLYFEGVAI